ncbi:consortin isoform X2 [Antennarius striatus]
MSQDQVGGVDVCDNLPNPEAFTAQTQNLNERNPITQSQSFSLVQKDDDGGHGPVQQASFSSKAKDMEEEWENKGYTSGCREEDEEEDTDEVMKEEEEEMSEGSSSLICCQSPDILMTDSSYSETGSLLETPYPFSPGTSPEPTYPVLVTVNPDAAYPSHVVLSQYDVRTDLVASNTGSITLGPTLTTEPAGSVTLSMTSCTYPSCLDASTSITEAKKIIAKNTNSSTKHCTSSTEPTCTRGVSTSHTGPISSIAKTVPSCPATLNTSMDSTTGNATTGPLVAAPVSTGVPPTSSTGPITSNWEQITSTPVPTCFSVSSYTKGVITNHDLLDALEQLAQRGDDTHLPQYLHQIAEAFVLQEDYPRALWCIQLERVYHQRVLDNLNALQEQWESRCQRSSTEEATKHLDNLRLICRSHTRPSAKDAECASLDVLRPTSVEGAILPPCISAHQIHEGMEQRSSHSQSCRPVKPSTGGAVRLNAPEISQTDTEDLHRGLDGRDDIDNSQLTHGHSRDVDEGKEEGEYTNSVIKNELHPSNAEEMDQSKPAEQQGGVLSVVQEKEAKGEEEERDDDKEEVEAMEMEGEEEEEEEDNPKEGDTPFYQKALPVESLVSGVESHQESRAEEQLHDEAQEITETCLHQETDLPQDVLIMQQQEWDEEEEEEEQEDEYEMEQADIIREAASLEDIAKLITVEMSPASGLVSILKKRHVCMDTVGMSSGSVPQPDKPPAKRRVRFSVPPDGSEQDVGSVDSCLLLFLLCLVTVVISVGGTALYCALGDAQSSVCQDFSRNADFYFGHIHRGISHIQHWFSPAS